MISGIKDTFDPIHTERLQKRKINIWFNYRNNWCGTKKLETICDSHKLLHINYLSIDVESVEFEVIKPINFDKVYIDVIKFEIIIMIQAYLL